MRYSLLLLFTILTSSIAFNCQSEYKEYDTDYLNKYYTIEELNKEQAEEYTSFLVVKNKSLDKTEKIKHYSRLLDQMLMLDMYKRSVVVLDTLTHLLQGDENLELAEVYVNKSLVFDALGNYPEALKASQSALKIYTNVNNYSGKATCFSDIGVLHYYRGEDSLAREYLQQALQINIELNDSSGIAQCYNNMANTYFETDDYEKAIETYNKGLVIDQALNDVEGQSIFLSNIGETYTYLEQFDKAEEYLQKSLLLAESLNDPWTISNPLRGLGELYQIKGDYAEAINVVKRSIDLCKKIDALPELSYAYQQLYSLSYEKGDFKNAIKYLELHHQANDSLFNKDKETIFKEMEVQYQVADKNQKLILAQKNKEVADLAHQKEINENKEKQNLILIGLICVGLVLLVVVFNVIQKKKANKLLREQNQIIKDSNDKINLAYLEIEEKSNEILDSIVYAKRIQSAILPSPKNFMELLPKSFVFYKPKDIVAGDFYWLENKADNILFAVADCTGHGVPGAMVSVVCNNALNRSVREYNLTDPAEILGKTRSLVLEEFEKSEDDVKDGMDIALCSLNGRTLKYAGAHNPLWIVRDNQIIEIKADKQPIGKFEFEKPFTCHEFDLEEGDSIYIFSDGYPDQFGGPKGKKYKTITLKRFLISIQDIAMYDQKELLAKEFVRWQGNLEQVDDVCVIGISV